jgi:hypothetical protein
MQNNLLIQSNNLTGLNYLLNNGLSGKIDLVYIDPPYAAGGNFTITNGRATTISNSLIWYGGADRTRTRQACPPTGRSSCRLALPSLSLQKNASVLRNLGIESRFPLVQGRPCGGKN